MNAPFGDAPKNADASVRSKTIGHAFDIDGHALPASSHRRSRGPVPIRVFCVHRLAASALRFLLCGAAGRCWRTHCQARVAAHASGATPSHCACIAPRFCCGQRLRCAFVVQNLPSRPHTPAATKFDRECIVALRTSNCSTLPCALDQSRSPPRGWPPARSDLPRNDIALTRGVERPAQPS